MDLAGSRRHNLALSTMRRPMPVFSGPGAYSTGPVTSQALPPPEPRYGAIPSPQIDAPGALAPDPLFSTTQEAAPLRQPTTLSAPGRVATLGETSPEMWWVVWFCTATILLFMGLLLAARVRLEEQRAALDQLYLDAED